MTDAEINNIAHGIERAMNCNECPAADVCCLSVKKCHEWLADWMWGVLHDSH